jgi:hypothetical protein
VLDFSEPVVVLYVAALHFITDEQEPWGLVSAMTEPLVPGSYLALSHTFLGGPAADVVEDVQERLKHSSAPVRYRSRDAITGSSTGSSWSTRAWCTPPSPAPTNRNAPGPVPSGCWPE